MKGTTIVIGALFLGLILASIAFVGAVVNINSLEHDITQYEVDVKGYIEGINSAEDTIRDRDNRIVNLTYELENYKCPEEDPILIYINTTEYVYDTIYLNNIQFDVTGDGLVDYNDVCAVLHYVNKGLRPAEELFYGRYPNGWEILYDVDRNGCVNLTDVELIMEYSGEIW